MFTGTQAIKGVGIFIGTFGLTIMCLAIGSIPSAFSTDSILEKAELQTAVKFSEDARACLESEYTSTSEKMAAVSLAGLSARQLFPDEPSKWEFWFKLERELEKLHKEEIKTRIANW